MLDGRVTVNGAVVRELGTRADSAHDDIRVDGRRVRVAEHHRYLVLNKPRGYVTTRSDPQRRPTVANAMTRTIPAQTKGATEAAPSKSVAFGTEVARPAVPVDVKRGLTR